MINCGVLAVLDYLLHPPLEPVGLEAIIRDNLPDWKDRQVTELPLFRRTRSIKGAIQEHFTKARYGV
jgi:hypothetical protein